MNEETKTALAENNAFLIMDTGTEREALDDAEISQAVEASQVRATGIGVWPPGTSSLPCPFTSATKIRLGRATSGPEFCETLAHTTRCRSLDVLGFRRTVFISYGYFALSHSKRWTSLQPPEKGKVSLGPLAAYNALENVTTLASVAYDIDS